MKTLLSVMLLAAAGPCTPRVAQPDSHPDTAKAAIAAWSDAYNQDDAAQLRWLVHPDQRDTFDDRQGVITGELADWQVVRYRVGPSLEIKGRMTGREVEVDLTDDRRMETRSMVLVESEGRWWVWRL